MELFPTNNIPQKKTHVLQKHNAPLAERLRPITLDNFVGQTHLLGEGKPLSLLIASGEIPSMIFWGPPGTGKTTLARILANNISAEFFQLNAVSSGVKEVRDVISRAELNRKRLNKRTILFIDEIHRFNKAQQDALLHCVEEGIVTLIGATTENPSFEVISPLLSRCRVYVLASLGKDDFNFIIERALREDEVLKREKISLGNDERDLLMLLSAGDARMLLNGLEIAVRLSKLNANKEKILSAKIIEEAFQRKYAKYDKAGEEHYNTISAFIKSLRGSDPDASVYYLARMLDAGEDILFIARRMVILASEDIGNANPQALVLATSCFQSIHYIGMPEARIILSQTAIYLASSPKSNASYFAIENAMEDVVKLQNLPIPLHLRNAPTKLMKELNYGKDYKYAHHYEGNFIETQYLPDNLKNKIYYEPTENGEEQTIKERLKNWWMKKRK
ncbi:MAG: replication-associated recombination protein A [Ignavibacteria bacterium]|nr:replication-associated recombination protein A [Ignavibacteria bacterium]